MEPDTPPTPFDYIPYTPAPVMPKVDLEPAWDGWQSIIVVDQATS